MLYLIKYKCRANPPLGYNFYWHSGGDARHKIICTEQYIKENAPFFSKIKSTPYAILSDARQMPKDIDEFFKELRYFIDFDYTVNGKMVYVAVVPGYLGKFIGIRGRNIREIEKHLDIKIEAMPAFFATVHFEKNEPCWGLWDIEDRTSKHPRLIATKVELDEDAIFKKIKGPSYGFAVIGGWVAPWHINRKILNEII